MTADEYAAYMQLEGKYINSKNSNDALRRKLEAAEAMIRDQLHPLIQDHQELTREFMLKSERLAHALQIIERAGLIQELPAVKSEPERAAENDARTPTQNREIT